MNVITDSSPTDGTVCGSRKTAITARVNLTSGIFIPVYQSDHVHANVEPWTVAFESM